MRWIALLCLAGCASQFQCPTIAVPGALVEETELRAEWVKRFGPLPSPACDPVLQWVVKSHEDTQRDCPLSQTFKDQGFKGAAGCTSYQAGKCPLVTIDERNATDRGLRAHEAAHWYLQCTWVGNQKGPWAERYGDPNHTIPEVWVAGGYVEFFRAQNQAAPVVAQGEIPRVWLSFTDPQKCNLEDTNAAGPQPAARSCTPVWWAKNPTGR